MNFGGKHGGFSLQPLCKIYPFSRISYLAHSSQCIVKPVKCMLIMSGAHNLGWVHHYFYVSDPSGNYFPEPTKYILVIRAHNLGRGAALL